MFKFFIFSNIALMSCFNQNTSNKMEQDFQDVPITVNTEVSPSKSPNDCKQEFIGIFKNSLVFDNFKLKFLELHTKEGKIDTLRYPKNLSADHAFENCISFSEKEYKGKGLILYNGIKWDTIQAGVKNYFYCITNNKVFYNDNSSSIFIFDMQTSTTKLAEEGGRVKFVVGDDLYLTSEIDEEGSYQGDELYSWNYKTKGKPKLVFSGGYADYTVVDRSTRYVITFVKKSPSEKAVVAYNPSNGKKQLFDITHGTYFYYNEFEQTIVFYKCNPTSSDNVIKKIF